MRRSYQAFAIMDGNAAPPVAFEVLAEIAPECIGLHRM